MHKRIILYIFFSTSFLCFSQSKQPKIIVGIVIDQMCYDYLYRFQDKFSQTGFRKLMDKGTNCRSTNYNYVPTYTGPGHASIFTGTTPDDHGIVGNEWYARNSKKVVNCVADNLYQSIGTTSNEGKCSPRALKTYTITDQLKLTYPSAKVISVSIKNRGAILPGGHLSDGSYWFDYSSGKMITSSFYKKVLPTWVEDFNKKEFPKNALKLTWNTLYPIESYTESGPDNSPYEELLSTKKEPTFPYNFAELSSDLKDFSLFTVSPFANTFLTNFALEAILNENMGTDKQPDFLCVSYSTPDIAGHAFGPYSVEIEDLYLRLDQDISRLLTYLEDNFGKNGFTLFLTADHAVVPVPQYLMDKNLPGGYIFLDEKMAQLRKSVKEKFEVDVVEVEENQNIYLNYNLIDSLRLSRRAVETFISDEIKIWKGVKDVFSTDDFKKKSDKNWVGMVARGYSTDRSGDIIYLLEPGYLPKSTDTPSAHQGTSHGSAFNYDSHVPLIWFGAGIRKQDIFRPIEIIDIAPTLTHLLNLQRTGAMTGNPIVEILNRK